MTKQHDTLTAPGEFLEVSRSLNCRKGEKYVRFTVGGMYRCWLSTRCWRFTLASLCDRYRYRIHINYETWVSLLLSALYLSLLYTKPRLSVSHPPPPPALATNLFKLIIFTVSNSTFVLISDLSYSFYVNFDLVFFMYLCETVDTLFPC